MNIWMIGNNLMKFYYQKRKIFTVTDADYVHGKRVCKDFEIKH